MVQQTDSMSVIYEILSGFASVNLTAGYCDTQQLQQNRSDEINQLNTYSIGLIPQMKPHAWKKQYIG